MTRHLTDDSGSDVPEWDAPPIWRNVARPDDRPATRAWSAAGIVLLAGWIGMCGVVSGIWIERAWTQANAELIGGAE